MVIVYRIYNVIILAVLLFYSFFFAANFERRKKFVWRMIGSILCALPLSLGISLIDFHLPGYWSVLQSTLKYILLQIEAVVCVCFCYKISVTTSVFLTIVAYTYRHSLYLIAKMVTQSFSVFEAVKNNEILYEYIILLITHFIFLPVFFYLYFYLGKRKNFNISKMKIILVSIFGSLVNVTYNSFVMSTFALYEPPFYYVYRSFNLIICILFIILMFSFLNLKELNEEMEIMNHIHIKEQEQFQINKENIELINIKCHDLKHQIRNLSEIYSNIDQKEIDALTKAIEIYDTRIQTGNKTLDIILQEKSLICRKYNVSVEAMVDGKLLSFIPEGDLYSMMGNILDNAIESVQGIKNENKRIITLKVKKVGGGYLFMKKTLILAL